MMTKLEEKSVEELEQILINRRKQNPHKYFIPNGKAEEFIKMVGEGKTFVCFFSGGNGTSKTSTGSNIVAHIIYGLSGNPYFNYPLFENFPFPKRGRIISDPTTAQNVIVPELKKWMPKGRYNTYKKGKNYEVWWRTDTKFSFDIMCLRPDQRITMSNGMEIPIAKVKVGDKVKCSEGDTKVVNIFESYAPEFYKVRTNNGNEIVCSYKHPIFTRRGWVRAVDLRLGDEVVNPNVRYKFSPNDIQEWQCFLLGILLGDGHIKGNEVKFTCYSEGLLEYTRELLPGNLQLKAIKNGEYRLSQTNAVKNNPIKRWLAELGLWGKLSAEKFVPDEVFTYNNAQIASLLRGLFSTDGSFNPNGHTISYYSRSSRLCNDVKKLLRRFGIVSRVYSYYRESEFDGYDCSGVINICQLSDSASIKKFGEYIGFVGKKADFNKFLQNRNTKSYPRRNRVSKIEIIDGGYCLDIEVESAVHNYIVDGLIVHNTYEQAVSEFESATLGWAWFDEPPPQAIFKATVARMRRGGIIFITATPLTGSAWLYDHIVAYQAGGNKEQRDFVFADVEDNCFANNTEILTENGWKDFESLSKSEIVATYNLLSEQLEYQSITGFIKKKWNGELIDIGLGLLATPNHRMVVLSDRNFRNKKPRIKEASGLYRGLRMIGAPKNVESRPFTVPFGFNGADWCEFLGWYLSEGCASGVNGTTSQVGKYQIYISQNEGEKKEIIKDLLQRMGLPVHERKGDIWFTNKEIHQYLIVLGNKYQKYIPREVFNYPKEWLARLWESLLLGDGDGKKRYVTTSKRLSDDIQEVLILLGYKSSLREWHPKTRGFNKRLIPAIQYCINANKRKFYHVNKIKTVFYDGMVYCVSVPNGTIVVRSKKEKYPLITGNCQTHGIRGFLQHEHIEKMIAEYSEDEKQARVHGKFAHLTGLVFKGFNRKVHVIKPFTITKKDYIVTEALDPHPRNPDAVMWMATNKNGDHIVCNELYGNYKTGELAERIKSGSKEYRVESRICDPSAFIEDQHQSDPKQQSLARRLYDLDLDYQPATKDRVAANRRIDDALYYEKSGNEMISAPELYIFDTCARTIWELEHYQWDDWRGKAAERKSPKETPQDKDDHMIENLGRLLLQEPEFISPPAQTVYRPVGVKSEESFDPFE